MKSKNSLVYRQRDPLRKRAGKVSESIDVVSAVRCVGGLS